MNKKEHKSTSPFSSVGIRSYIAFAKPWRFKLLVVLIVFVASNILIAIQPVFLGKLVDEASRAPINSESAWMMAIILALLSITHNILWRLAEILYRWLILPISFAYETHLFKHVIAKPYPYFVDKFTGKVSSYITNISTELRSLTSNALFNYVGSIVAVASVLAIATSVNWQTGLIIFVCLTLMFFTGRYTLGKDMYYQKIEADKNSTKNGHIVDAIANFVSVKSFHKESQELREISHQQNSTLKASKQSFFWGIVFWGSMSVYIRDIMWPVVVLLNLWLLLQGQITIGQFTTVLSTALLFTQTIWEIVWNISQFGQQVSRVEEAHTYLFGRVNIAKQTEELEFADKNHTLFSEQFGIHNLTFAYPDKPDTQVLTNLNLTIQSGEKIGIVGKSGSGKSTLVKLLLDQYDTPHGTFTFDDRTVSSRELSRFIAYVPQDTALFHRSIADNIGYAARDTPTREQILIAAKRAEADEFVVHLSQGYDTLVGERGVKLSGGQRQRIAIARAFLMDSPILVLDEATSALDSESELLVQKALENLWQDKTVIAIAHRLSTLRNMDRIIVLDAGKIVELGSHAELLAREGIYAKLWAHQSGGFIEE